MASELRCGRCSAGMAAVDERIQGLLNEVDVLLKLVFRQVRIKLDVKVVRARRTEVRVCKK